MKKSDIITQIESLDANLVWEIDSPLYYPFIGWNGGNDSYWLNQNLSEATVATLTKLLTELKTRTTQMC